MGVLTIPYLQYTQLYTKTYCGLWLVIDDLPDTLGVSAGRALLPVNISDPAALLGLALGQFVSLGVPSEECPAHRPLLVSRRIFARELTCRSSS